MSKIQITVSIPKILADSIGYYVDGVRFRNRSHIIHQAIDQWLERQTADRKKQLTIEDAPGMKRPAKVRNASVKPKA